MILIILAIIITPISLYIAYDLGREKGIGVGRMQLLEEEMIRMDKSDNSSNNDTEFYQIHSKPQPLSRQSCQYIPQKEELEIAA